ncbi:hypothetical protein MP228_007141 [Amoeboaphelidium protococcarum]|nr:hypothetical protein MP228_007141 [Amoeboaphelidium protococcarum]
MTRPSQKRKRRNPSLKVSRRVNKKLARRPQPMQLAQMIQQNLQESSVHLENGDKQEQIWSNHMTVEQNYDKIGLRVRVNGITGGIDGDKLMNGYAPRDVESSGLLDEIVSDLDGVDRQKLSAIRAQIARQQKTGVYSEGKIVRDVDGNVVGIEEGFNGDGDGDDDKQIESSGQRQETKHENPYAEAILLGAQNQAPAVRWASEGQLQFIQECIDKYGENYTAMAKDLKLNCYQYTPAQIERKIKKLLQNY